MDPTEIRRQISARVSDVFDGAVPASRIFATYTTDEDENHLDVLFQHIMERMVGDGWSIRPTRPEEPS